MKAFLFILFIGTSVFAEISESVRKEYADKFHQAFILQSEGKSTQAFYSFQSAFQQGTQVGESPIKLQVIADLFYWYRRYGTHLSLFAKNPTGGNVITDEYRGHRCSRHSHAHKYSEWGKDPKQAHNVQNFVFGAGEIIIGIFCVYTSPTPGVIQVGGGLIGHGFYMMFDSLHELWTDHEIEEFELQKINERAEALPT